MFQTPTAWPVVENLELLNKYMYFGYEMRLIIKNKSLPLFSEVF